MKITIYTITDCQFSKQEKEYLTSHNLQFEEKNLETNHEYLTEMLNVSNNFAGTPVTKLEKDDGNIVVLKGFTAEEFDKELGFAKEEKKEEPKEKEATPAPEKNNLSDISASPSQPVPPTPGQPVPPSPVPTPQAPEPSNPQPTTPTIPNQSAQPQTPQMPDIAVVSPPTTPEPSFNTQPQPPVAPQAPVQPQNATPEESTIDDASLDAILNQLQEKTNAPGAQGSPQSAPQANGAPSIPDFGGNNT